MDSENEQFIRIYDQYIDKIYRFVYLKVNSQEIAEDITSKVFLKGWENYRGEPKKIENMSAFLYQIARNSIVDHYREKSKTKIVSTDFASKIADSKVAKSIDWTSKTTYNVCMSKGQTFNISMPSKLVKQVDRQSKLQASNRSDFIRQA